MIVAVNGRPGAKGLSASVGNDGPRRFQSCMRPCPPDALPILGGVPGVEGAYMARPSRPSIHTTTINGALTRRLYSSHRPMKSRVFPSQSRLTLSYKLSENAWCANRRPCYVVWVGASLSSFDPWHEKTCGFK